MADENKKGPMERESNEFTEGIAEGSPVSQEELTHLRESLEAKEKEARENHDRYLRQVAEVENFKKRITREKDEAIRYANENLIKDLLPVIDNLERAIAHSKGGGNGKPLVEGVEMVFKGLLDVFGKYGVVPVAAIGELFDPGKHDAMAQVETSQHEPNTVVDEHHKGYFFHDRLLRPALVTVAKTPTTNEKKNGDTEVEKGPSDD